MKNFIMGTMIAISMVACSNEDEMVPNMESYEGNVVFEISAVNKLSDGTETKGAVYSQEATQNVTDVKVYAFVSTDMTNYYWTKTLTISDWTVGTTFKRYALTGTDKLQAGNYKFLAVGRDASDMFTLPNMSSALKFEDVVASVTASGNESEIFAGFAAAQISSEGGGRVSIEMIRKVAGVLGYFKNVPQSLNGQTVRFLRLTVNNSNQQVNLTTGAGINTTVAPFRIIDIDLSTQSVVNGVYSGNDLSGAGVMKVANSQLGGLFLIPVNGVSLTLGLYAANGTALKEWEVKDSSGNLTTFDIQANHFYSLGIKTKADTTTGDPTDPGDDDDPIDLLTDQNIVITINPSWELIHNLVIQ